MARFPLILSLVFMLSTLASAKPIMVTFGTNQGPIVPRQQSISIQPRSSVPTNPAPVSEEREDIPNPSTYRPLIPHQYRTKIYSFRPNANLILGTPIDQKYTPVLQKYNTFKKQQLQSRNLGLEYTGPQLFEKQDYEYFDAKKRTTLQPSVSYVKPHYYQQKDGFGNGNKFVPQIGIVYSAGVRYYVPQVFFYQKREGEEENSVYDRDDQKYLVKSN